MTTQKLISKSALILLVLLVAGVSAGHIRTLLWDDPYCNTFSADGTCCLKCSFHYWMDRYGRCNPVSDWCKTWQDSTGCCTSCFPGYGNPVNGVCASAPVTTVPNPPIETDDHCACYGYIDSAQRLYKSWVNGCRKVCTECDSGYYLNYNNVCVSLPGNCLAADSYGNCTQCIDGYNVENGYCVEDCYDPCIQYGYIDVHRKWSSVWNNGCKKVCKQCDSNYYLNCNYSCVLLPSYCTAADQDGNCTSCIPGYHVDNGLCVVTVAIDNCAQYGYLDSSRRWNPTWILGCRKVCKCCKEGFYLNYNYTCIALSEYCTAADQYGACTSCESGYHVENGACVQDDDHCAEYGYLDNSRRWWSSWTKDCQKVCKCCDPNYYLTSDFICVSLPAYCTEVDSTGACTDCVSGYHVQNGICVKDDDHCAQYQYLDSARRWASVWSSGCKKVCKSCKPGFYLNSTNQCVSLPPYCTDADSTGACTECVSDYHVVNGSCVKIDHCKQYGYIDSTNKWLNLWANGCKKVCKCCDSGYYLTSDYKCVAYPDNCIAVDSDGDCTKCCQGFKVKNGLCVPKISSTNPWQNTDNNWNGPSRPRN